MVSILETVALVLAKEEGVFIIHFFIILKWICVEAVFFVML